MIDLGYKTLTYAIDLSVYKSFFVFRMRGNTKFQEYSHMNHFSGDKEF